MRDMTKVGVKTETEVLVKLGGAKFHGWWDFMTVINGVM